MKDGEFDWNLYHDMDKKSYEQDRLNKLQSLRIVELEADVERLIIDANIATDQRNCFHMIIDEERHRFQTDIGALEEQIRILKEENERLKNEK